MERKTTYIDELDLITEALGQSDGQTSEEVWNELKEDGIDVEGDYVRFMDKLNDLVADAKRKELDLARSKRMKVEGIINQVRATIAGWTEEERRARKKQLFADGQLSAAVSFRDLESISEEDLDSLIDDAELARLIAEEEAADE
jgi:hypothetical protein